MDQEIKWRWIKALRSGHYRQGEGMLYENGSYCCLGVLCDVQSNTWRNNIYRFNTSQIPKEFRAGLTNEDCLTFAGMNDNGVDFQNISKTIEEKF